MNEIVEWCNSNSGFLSGIYSLVGIILSLIAIVVSIHTARLPYKKKVILGSSMLVGSTSAQGLLNKPVVMGYEATVTNVGNRGINFTYIGYAIKDGNKTLKIYPLSNGKIGTGIALPAEVKSSQFFAEELFQGLATTNQQTKIYVYARDSEDKEYFRKAGTVGKLLENMRSGTN